MVRNDSGNLIMAFSVPIQSKRNNQAEAMAAMYEINWCKQAGFNIYDLELESLVITEISLIISSSGYYQRHHQSINSEDEKIKGVARQC